MVRIEWSPLLAYAIGLITTDGCLSKDGRHIDMTSKDLEQIKTFLECLGLKNKIGRKVSGSTNRYCYRVQFGDVLFYKFLLSIGLSPGKTKILKDVDIPQKYFWDFMRGHFDGDGTFYSYYDSRWKSSFMFYTVFISASYSHIRWLQDEIFRLEKVKGHITHDKKKTTYQLKYAKTDSLKILRKMYYIDDLCCLKRKRLKIEKALNIIGLSIAQVA